MSLEQLWVIGDSEQLWRVLNAVTSIIAGTIMLFEAWYLRSATGDLTLRVRFRNIGGAIVLFALADGSIEAIIDNLPVYPRVYFLSIGTMMLLIAMLAPRKTLPLHPGQRNNP